jgi:hypothetical protein
VSIRERIEARAQNDDLVDATVNCPFDSLFRETMTSGDEQAHSSTCGTLLRLFHAPLGILAEDSNGEIVAKDAAALHPLMNRSMGRSAQRCSTWNACFQPTTSSARVKSSGFAGHPYAATRHKFANSCVQCDAVHEVHFLL